jgi:hypothetical protein
MTTKGWPLYRVRNRREPGAILRGKGREADGDTLAVDIAERLDVVVFSEAAI